jgi:Taurine catabolism dioxygenase TauD, TfdA family
VTDSFQAHHADPHSKDGREQLIEKLRDDGLVTFAGIPDRATLLKVASGLLIIYPHRDSGPDGITVITSSAERPSPGFTGFSSADLRPHTDRSGVPEPPLLIMLTCVSRADRGGESVMVDGQWLYEALAADDPTTLQALSSPRSALFGGASGFLGAIFSRTAERRVAVRLRLDELGQFSPQVSRALPRLLTLAEEHKLVLPLRAGQGYLIDNSRWLHGRMSFTGTRTMLRMLGNPRPGLAMQRGFAAPATRSPATDHAHA